MTWECSMLHVNWIYTHWILACSHLQYGWPPGDMTQKIFEVPTQYLYDLIPVCLHFQYGHQYGHNQKKATVYIIHSIEYPQWKSPMCVVYK
jgi:hypothetical protein